MRSACPETHSHTGGEGNFRPRTKLSMTVPSTAQNISSYTKETAEENVFNMYLLLFFFLPFKLSFQPCCPVNFPCFMCFATDPLGSLTHSGHKRFFHNKETFNKILKILRNIISRSTSAHHLSSGNSKQQFPRAL